MSIEQKVFLVLLGLLLAPAGLTAFVMWLERKVREWLNGNRLL